MQPVGTLPHCAWLKAPAVQRLMAVLKTQGAEARFVGGCVRDTLLNRPVTDIDIATTDAPTVVMDKLERAQIMVLPVGLSHGSVLAVIDHYTFNITTLRADVETHGRHATVEFIDDWEADAKRRDFTINALYADADGTVYDPCDGLTDLKTRTIRFIGNPLERIHEDYLRILRFFRFYATLGEGSLDEAALKACAETVAHIERLSGERVWYELRRLLIAEKALTALQAMASIGLPEHLFPGVSLNNSAFERLERLLHYEDDWQCPPDAIRRLACLLNGQTNAIPSLAKRLRLSNVERKLLNLFVHTSVNAGALESRIEHRRILYYQGKDAYTSLILLAISQNKEVSAQQVKVIFQEVIQESPLALPVQGRDLLKLGYKPGPQLGAQLKALEEWWLSHDSLPSKNTCLTWFQDRNKL